jgi:hypothetical protein
VRYIGGLVSDAATLNSPPLGGLDLWALPAGLLADRLRPGYAVWGTLPFGPSPTILVAGSGPTGPPRGLAGISGRGEA